MTQRKKIETLYGVNFDKLVDNCVEECTRMSEDYTEVCECITGILSTAMYQEAAQHIFSSTFSEHSWLFYVHPNKRNTTQYIQTYNGFLGDIFFEVEDDGGAYLVRYKAISKPEADIEFSWKYAMMSDFASRKAEVAEVCKYFRPWNDRLKKLARIEVEKYFIGTLQEFTYILKCLKDPENYVVSDKEPEKVFDGDKAFKHFFDSDRVIKYTISADEFPNT